MLFDLNSEYSIHNLKLTFNHCNFLRTTIHYLMKISGGHSVLRNFSVSYFAGTTADLRNSHEMGG